MKKGFIFSALLICLLGSTSGHAQGYSLQECIQRGLQVGRTMQQAQLDKLSAMQQAEQASHRYLPEIGASVSQTFDLGRSQDKTGVMQDRSSSHSSIGIGGSWQLYSGGTRPLQSKVAEQQIYAATAREERSRMDTELQIAELYYQLVFCLEVEKMATLQRNASQEMENKTREMVQVGKWSESKLSEIATQKAEDEVKLIQAQNDRELAQMQLQWALEIEDPNFSIAPPSLDEWIADAQKTLLPSSESIRQAGENNPELRWADSQITLTQYETRLAQRGYYPTLSLDFGYSNSYYYLLNKEYQPLNIPFEDQIKTNGRTYFGLTLQIPLFDKFTTSHQIKQARLQEQRALLDRKETERKVWRELRTADLNARSALRKIEATTLAEKQAQEALAHAQIGYEVGKTSSYDYSEAKNRHQQAEIERLRACIDFVYKAHIVRCYTQESSDSSEEK